MLKRHEIQVLRRAQHTWSEIAELSGVSEKTARRIATEAPIANVDNAAERIRRQVGRPSKAEAYRDVLVAALTEDPALRPSSFFIGHVWPATPAARAPCMRWRRRCGCGR